MLKKIFAIISFILICSTTLLAQSDISENEPVENRKQSSVKNKIIIKEISKKENRKLLYTNPEKVKKFLEFVKKRCPVADTIVNWTSVTAAEE